MLQHIINVAAKDASIAAIQLHVQTSNTDALECVCCAG